MNKKEIFRNNCFGILPFLLFLIPIYILPTHEETTNFYGDCPFSIDGLWWKSENNC